MMVDVEIIEFARKNKMDLNDLFYITKRKRLISKEIYLQEFKDVKNLRNIFTMTRNGKNYKHISGE